MKNIPVDSYIEESPKWEDLSIPEKAEMMKVAIRNGITSLPEIKQAYKEFAEGGNLFRKGGPKKQTNFGNAGSQRAMQYFMNKGLTQAQAAGLVGNLMRESGMQSTALNSSSKAFGIAQWLGPRKKALFARYGSNPTLDQQLDFVWHELNTTHRNGLRHLKASKTAAEAARNVMGYYEFSAGPEAAIAAMNRTGQAGNKSMLRGIEYASKLLGIPVSAEDYTPAVQENPLAPPVSDAQQMIQFTPWNPQAFYGYQAPQIEIPMEQPVQNIPTFTKEDVERAQRQQGMETFMALSNLLQPTGTPEAVVPRQRNNPYVAYQEGGNLFKEGGSKASSERIYEILPRLYAMDGVNVTLSSGNRLGSVVIENGKKTNRKSRHASGMAADIVPGKGSTFADMFRVLRDPNSNVSRYLQSVGGGYLDETSATGTTKYWHDHDRDHSHIHHQIGGYAGANYGKEMASILGGKAPMSTPSTQEQSTFLAFEPANPMAFFDPAAFQTPVIERPVVEPLVEEADVYSQKMQEIEDRRNNLNKLNMMLSLTSPSQGGNSLMSTIGMLTGNYSANGGPIHIKPSHRGRLTELKERTGKTEAELKHDGNPAHKKMVVFAENARKWHGLGGNLYDLGGDTVEEWINTIYQNNPKEDYLGEPAHHYDFTQSEEWANAHGYYPDARGHRDDRVKKPAHPSHSSRGVWDGDKFVLSELGMQNPNYTLFGLNDGGQDPQATLIYKGGNVIPETTVTPSGNYIFNPYDNIKIKFANGGHIYDGITEPTQQMDNSYSYIKPLSEVIVDNEGNVRDPEVPSARGTIQLPEVTVSMRDPRKYVSAFEGHQDWLRPMADFVPFVGDALQAKDAAVDAVNGDYLNAGIGAGLLLLPNVIEKPLKYIGKGVKRLWKATDSKLDDIYRLSPEQWTPEQWTAAQDAAIAKGDMAEAQRLRDLHFKVSAPNTKVVDGTGNPQLVIHKTPNDFTVFDNSRSIGNLNWAATPKAFEGENGVFATGAGTSPKEMRLYVNMKNPHYPTIDEGMEPAFINEGEDGILGIVDKDMTDFYRSASDAGEGFNMSLGVDNPYALKSAVAVTYDDNGIRIPLGERDNFNINDIRYGLLPFLGLGTAGTLYGKQE